MSGGVEENRVARVKENSGAGVGDFRGWCSRVSGQARELWAPSTQLRATAGGLAGGTLNTPGWAAVRPPKMRSRTLNQRQGDIRRRCPAPDPKIKNVRGPV